MADTKISNLTEDTAPTGGNYFPQVDDTAGTPVTKYTKGYHLAEMGPENYKISVTVASNNITVALKTLAGNNPSATDPIIFKIGDSWRTVTAALSVTKNAGTNWFGNGSATHATNERDYFVYIGYNATDGVVLGFSPIPYARQYGDFSATTTNEKYAAISTITTAASTDYYEVIGRFAATLSATASFNWSVPTFTAANLINRPIFETRELNFTPTWTNLTIGNGTTTAKYVRRGTEIFGHLEVIFGTTTSIGGDVSFVAPITTATYGGVNAPCGLTRYLSAGGGYQGAISMLTTTSLRITVGNASATYLQNSALSSTVPATWTTSDAIQAEFHYFGA